MWFGPSGPSGRAGCLASALASRLLVLSCHCCPGGFSPAPAFPWCVLGHGVWLALAFCLSPPWLLLPLRPGWFWGSFPLRVGVSGLWGLVLSRSFRAPVGSGCWAPVFAGLCVVGPAFCLVYLTAAVPFGACCASSWVVGVCFSGLWLPAPVSPKLLLGCSAGAGFFVTYAPFCSLSSWVFPGLLVLGGCPWWFLLLGLPGGAWFFWPLFSDLCFGR